jgi:ArsR family transcriptional regulator
MIYKILSASTGFVKKIQRAPYTMSSALKSLRALSDPTRLRMVALLEREELSVNELQEVTRLGQSRISTHLGLLQDAGLLQSRREGKRTFYRANPAADGSARELIQLAIRGAKELPESGGDQINLKRILARRREQAQVYFNQIAGRFDRVYGPGSGICCCGFCRRWSWPTSARAKAC